MYRGNSPARRVLPIAIVLIVIAIAIAALVSVGRAVFGGNQTDPTKVDAGQQALIETEVSNSVRMTVRGPIVADENFRSYRISADVSGRNMTTYSGYVEQPIAAKDYANNLKAYEEFVYALSKANLMTGTPLTGAADDTRGICATGKVYEFEVLKDGHTVKHLWTSTCKGSPGSFRGSTDQVEKLFKAQIPDQKTLLKTIDL